MERGQAHTLEGVISGLLLLASIIFALQMTAVTPLSASTSSQHIENQQKAVATGVLASASEDGALKRTILYWDNSSSKFHGTTEIGYYTSTLPNTTFGQMLDRSFDENGISYNVYLAFQTSTADTVRKRLIYRGVPSDNAVKSTRTVTLLDTDHLYDSDGTKNASTVDESSTFYTSDIGTGVHNVVRVEVVAWRI